MTRIAAPVAKLTRAISSAPAVARSANPLLDSTSHSASVTLMPKYAELLRNRHNEHSDSSRGLSTQHRPTPQPSIANRTKPLMQTFHSSAAAAAAAPSQHIDATVLPNMDFETVVFSAEPRVPILPDNYNVAHGPASGDAPVHMPAIVAADPDRVLPATPLSSVDTVGLDGVELKFVHEQPKYPQEAEGGMLRDLWKGMVDDVLGPAPVQKAI